MSNPLSFLLIGAAGFFAIAAIILIRGFILKERIYKIVGLACILMALASISLSFMQPEAYITPLAVGGGFFIVAALLIFTNYSKIFEASSREISTASTETDFSKPIKISDLFMWAGWFKIVNRWGARKAYVLYALFSLCSGLIIPLALWIFNIGNTFFVAIITITVIVGAISSIPIFHLQVVKNLKTSNDNGRSNHV
jgi:hypothetical protein